MVFAGCLSTCSFVTLRRCSYIQWVSMAHLRLRLLNSVTKTLEHRHTLVYPSALPLDVRQLRQYQFTESALVLCSHVPRATNAFCARFVLCKCAKTNMRTYHLPPLLRCSGEQGGKHESMASPSPTTIPAVYEQQQCTQQSLLLHASHLPIVDKCITLIALHLHDLRPLQPRRHIPRPRSIH